MRKANIPNALTILRILIIPFFAAAILTERYITAIILFSLGGLSDVLDGYLARKYNLVSEFGKVADPLADKLMQFTALLALTLNGLLSPVIIIIIGVKEMLMGIGTLLVFRKKRTIKQASWYGKLTTSLIYSAVILILLDISAGWYVLYLAVASAIFSLVMYGMIAGKAIKKD